MKRIIFVLFLLILMIPSTLLAKEAYLSMIYTNALQDELPFAIFSKGSWSPDPKARFVKLHLYFDDPIVIKGLEIDPCGSNLKPELSIFFNFDQWLLAAGPELKGEIPKWTNPVLEDGLLKVKDMDAIEGTNEFQKTIEVRSLTLNFENQAGFRICGIHLKDPNGQDYEIKTPKLLDGKVEASSVLGPKMAYDPIFLFDSRFEYGWASNKKEKDVSLVFTFDQPRRIEKLRIWNGYQRSVKHYNSNSRPTKIRMTGDGDYKTEFEVANRLGSQLITLSKPYEGKTFKLDVIESILGKSYKDLVISEIRFYDGKEWFMLDPTEHLKKNIASNRKEFSKAGVDTLLNDSVEGQQAITGKTDVENPYEIWSKLRLRADGSLYMSGDMEGEMGIIQYFALGNYEIKEANETNGITLRLFGLYYETKVYGDCNGCGRDCNKNDIPNEDPKQKIFQEIVTIKPTKIGTFELINKSGGKKIKFDKMIFKPEKKVYAQ
jgi:hypothetical protein